ncbi:energy transducer TonB [Spongiivirga sp. MCCC 1A20706]|uniref:energy transducer TonB n=1 Tax=Spongiivirga sp. MCCC 1A20706 TaxID=3160963 RepID=UPI003977650B
MNSKKNAEKHDGRHVSAKKYTKHDANLQKNNGLIFAISMVLTLLAVYFVIEVEVPEKQVAYVEPEVLYEEVTYTINNFRVEEEQKIEEVVKKEKKVVKNIEKILVDENDDSGKETDIVTEPDPSTEKFDPNAVTVIPEPDPDFIIPASTVEQVPMFEECLEVPKTEQRKCFEEGMMNHVKKTFRYPDVAIDLGLNGRVYTTFTIDKSGNIKDVKLRGPHKILEKEAARIISKLPKMIPGKQGIHNVNVSFSLPITFKLQ